MPILRKWEYNGAICGIWKVTETTDELRSLLTDKSFTPEFFIYKSYSRQLEFLAVRALIRELTGAEQRVLHYESGKPYLDGCKSKISISHTKGYVAVVLHPEKETGIDIEYRSDRVKKVVTRFISDKEMSLIDNRLLFITDEDEKDCAMVNMYLLFWSAKETMFKMLDSSGVDFLEHLQVRSIIISELYTKSDGFSFPEVGVFYGELETVAFKDPGNDVEMNIELYVSQDFVCTYSVSD
jgi:phosphopantetheinyl transferase (holo-ACP synthase)